MPRLAPVTSATAAAAQLPLMRVESIGEQLARDDRALDLVGAFVDLRDLGVAVEPLDLEAADIADAAEDLHGIGGVRHGHVAGEAFGHRAGRWSRARRDRACGGRVCDQQRARRAMSFAMSASIHCRPWNSAIGLPNWRARLGIVERRLEPGLGDADGERRDADAALVEHAHHDVEAAALGAEQGIRRQRDVVEVQRADLARRAGPSCAPSARASTPAASRSTMKMLMPRWPAALSVRASTKPKSATGALWIQSLRAGQPPAVGRRARRWS